jgi:hypothetical protein
MNENTVKLVAAVVDLVKGLVWPAIVVWLILRFREQVSGLLTRLASIKVAGQEFVFQPQVAKATEVPPQRRFHLQLGADGFLTIDSVRSAVTELTREAQGEVIRSELLIFQTPKQRTWLIATNRHTFVVLDDETTRRKASLVQTFFGLEKTLPLEFGVSPGAGTVRFAAEDTWWYYSKSLFATTDSLTAAVRRMVQMAT